MNVNYSIKKIDEVLNSLRDCKHFFKLDLFKAYLHLQTDEESSIIQTISTHRGTYKMNRLSFGIKTAPAEFNRVIDQILNGLSKTIAHFDDIVARGKTKDQCSKNLFACLEKLREYDLHLNFNKETEKDQELAQIKQEILSSPINSDYILDRCILFRNNRIVIPKTLQSTVLNELHSTHIRITKMKQLEGRYCIWKNIDKDIENLVKSCKDCSSVKHSPAKTPLHHWDLPINNWDRIHIDYAGPFQGFHCLIVVDAKSRCVEINVIAKLT
ncbi:Uncharacterized protein K02A2.6 [Araneus ventricosus]|uniref:RNA-directed DNA polymerase n=1 Tax=Araneus ventricosus TaxID=182803 RepID=A0A4Y2GEW0_ARAVE|nr:Uncharacterized protein K02A2.6 [Araneus ventricosus]